MSAVFEYVNGAPISVIREFAPRVTADGSSNLCEKMIDCQSNPWGSKTCKDSDVAAANESRSKLKKILYRCHGGSGFVNLAIPIKIWDKIVVLNLYMGQGILRIGKDDHDIFIRKLNARNICVMPGQDVDRILRASTLDEGEIYAFAEKVIPPTQLPPLQGEFLTQFKKQQENGMTMGEFFNAVDFLDKIADRLSELGNLLYTLKAFVDINRHLPKSLTAHMRSQIERLQSDIRTLVFEKKEDEPSAEERTKAVHDFHRGYLEILLLLRNHETEYVQSLLRPYLKELLEKTDRINVLILNFLFLRTYLEAQRYSKAMEKARSLLNHERARLSRDDFIKGFFDVAREIGSDESTANLVTQGIIGLYNNAPTIWRPLLPPDRLISILMGVCKNDRSQIDNLLKTHGLYQTLGYALATAKEEEIREFAVPLPLITRKLECVRDRFAEINDEVSQISGETVEPDIDEIRDYIERVTEIREEIIVALTYDTDPEFKEIAQENRKQMDLRYDRFFANSGGLGPNLQSILKEQEWWIAKRNEEGPVGITLEKTLSSKIGDARKSVSRLLGDNSVDDVAFTYGTTDGIEFILNGIIFQPHDEVVFTDVEFTSVENLKKSLLQKGVFSTTAEISKCLDDDSKIVEKIAEQITPKTRLVIISHVAYGTGYILPVKGIAEKCRDNYERITRTQDGRKNGKPLILVDGAQAAGNIPVSVHDLGCDFYAFDGHKWLQGPEGSGAVYIKDFLNKINSGDYSFLAQRAFMISENCQRALNAMNNYDSEQEKATADVAKIIGFGKSVELFLEKDPRRIAKRKARLVGRFLKKIRDLRYFSIMNKKSARDTGMIYLKVKDINKPEEYRKIAEELQEMGVYVRYVKKPACIRIGFHFNFNNETDVDVVVGALRVIVEGISMHRADLDRVKEHLKDLINEYIFGNRSSDGKAGLIIYGPSATGKTKAIKEILEELSARGIRSSTVTRERLLEESGSAGLANSFTQELIKARKSAPYIMFFEECDQLFAEIEGVIIGDFKTQCDIMLEEVKKKEKKPVFFLGTTNRIGNICHSVKKRLNTAYWPLPSFETRLAFLMKNRQECKHPVSEIAYEQISGGTDGFSMGNMKDLWTKALEIAEQEGAPLGTAHFRKAIEQGVIATTPQEKIKEYERNIRENNSIILSNRSGLRFRI